VISRLGYTLWIALALACGSALAQEIRWAPDIATARRAAMEYKVPVMIHFYGDNCLPCKLLEQNVLTKAEIVDTLNKYFICVRVNGSQERQIAAQYGVHSWPTDVFLGPDGKPLDQGVCKQNPGEYLSVLHNMAVLNRDRNVLLAAQQTESARQVSSQVANYAQPSPPAQPTGNPTQGATGPGAVAPQLNVLGGPLPAAGAIQPGNPNGPNFYAQGQGSGIQQLPGSLPPNSSVISGPMLSQNQPNAVTTPVAAAGSQIAAASKSHDLQAHQGQLPPMQFNGQVPPASHPASLHPTHTMVAGAPTVSAAMAPALPSGAQRSPSPRVSPGHAQTLDNPHFAGAPPLPGMPATAATDPAPKIAANTVSFQPRAALSVDSNRMAASAQPAQAMTASVITAPTAPAVATEVMPAIDGYCPMTLKKQGTWVKGQPQFAVKHRGRIYHFDSPAMQQEFLQSPDNSSPVLAGYDPMVFLNSGTLVDGNIQHGLLEQVSGSILLFSSEESKQAYEQNYDRNTQALQVVLRKAGVER